MKPVRDASQIGIKEKGLSSKYIDHIRPMGFRVMSKLVYDSETGRPATFERVELVDNGRVYLVAKHLVIKNPSSEKLKTTGPK